MQTNKHFEKQHSAPPQTPLFPALLYHKPSKFSHVVLLFKRISKCRELTFKTKKQDKIQIDKGKHVKSMHCLECNAYAGIKIFLVKSISYLIIYNWERTFTNPWKQQEKMKFHFQLKSRKYQGTNSRIKCIDVFNLHQRTLNSTWKAFQYSHQTTMNIAVLAFTALRI